jgi:hypothetical protein
VARATYPSHNIPAKVVNYERRPKQVLHRHLGRINTGDGKNFVASFGTDLDCDGTFGHTEMLCDQSHYSIVSPTVLGWRMNADNPRPIGLLFDGLHAAIGFDANGDSNDNVSLEFDDRMLDYRLDQARIGLMDTGNR